MVEIPQNKKYFRIGEASRIVGVEPYVLRYWEGEFPQLRPRRADSNQRTYQRRDIETLLKIRQLLYEEGMTIQGAKQRLKRDAPDAGPPTPFALVLEEIRADLKSIQDILA